MKQGVSQVPELQSPLQITGSAAHVSGEISLFAVYVIATVGVVTALLALSYFVGPRTRGKARDIPFESGILPIGGGHFRISPKFYLVAVFFVLFDLESVFIYGWAVAARKLGWSGYAEVAVFIAILLAALAYLWRRGGLNWGPDRNPSHGSRRHHRSANAEIGPGSEEV